MPTPQAASRLILIRSALRDAGLPLVGIAERPDIGLHVRPPYFAEGPFAPYVVRVRAKAPSGPREGLYARASRADEDRLLVAASRALLDTGIFTVEDDHDGRLLVGGVPTPSPDEVTP